MLLIFLLAVTLISSYRIPTGTRFDYEVINSFYNEGVLTTDGSPFGVKSLFGIGNIVVDQQNDQQRICYTFTLPTTPPTVVDVCAWILPNATYVKGNTAHPGCLINRNFNYSQLVIGYNDAFALPGSRFPEGANYMGYITNDAGTCGKAEALNLKVENMVITEYTLAGQILITVPTTNTTFCYHTKTTLEFTGKERYPQNSTSFDHYFQLPADCLSNPPDFCTYQPTCF
jgi:hypothetical protein